MTDPSTPRDHLAHLLGEDVVVPLTERECADVLSALVQQRRRERLTLEQAIASFVDHLPRAVRRGARRLLAEADADA